MIDGIDIEVKPNLLLRQKLEELSLDVLQAKLKKIDLAKFENMNESDVANKRRLIRAIEIARNKKQELSIKKERKYDALVIGLNCPREALRIRIDKRVSDRITGGALEEAEKLFENYENLSSQVKNANGYKQLFQFLKKEISFEEAIYRWKISENRHAKNQMTWFRKYGNVEWFDITANGFEKELYKRMEMFILNP